jgi:mannose-6-phosphate isomerase
MRLGPNRLARFYAGGPRIDALRGATDPGAGGPEDWVGSSTTAFRQDREGLSRLADGRFLRDAIRSDPVAFLGLEHVQRWGANPGLLVKLLDAGERLPVHFHPGRAFAREALGLDFGKTEAWIIVEAEPGAVVHLGFKTTVPASAAARWVAEQDAAALLAAMHELPVHAGQVVFVPAGTLHAIGAGILLVELQEPTDLSVLLEWQRFGVSSGVEHLGLGWERALSALDLSATALEEPARAGPAGPEPVQKLLPELAAPYFRAQRIVVSGEPVHVGPSFAVLVVLDGWLTVWSEHGERLELARGATALVPHAAGDSTFEGHARVIRCLPPAPDAGAGQW